MAKQRNVTNVSTSGGDYVGRDKVTKAGKGGTAVGGSMTGGSISTGAQVPPLDAIVRAVRELRTAAAASGLDRDEARVVDADLAEVETQLAKTKPSAGVVKAKLEAVKGVIAAAAGLASEAKENLLPLAQRAAEWIGYHLNDLSR